MYKIDLLFNDIFYPEICNINSKHRLKSLAKTIFCVESDKSLQVTGQTWKDFCNSSASVLGLYNLIKAKASSAISASIMRILPSLFLLILFELKVVLPR